jgi:hypothetical protein
MRTALCAALGLLVLGVPGANAITMRAAHLDGQSGTLLHKVHSLHEAKHSLRDLGYYDIEVERASLPYSFRACKRGVRYHIHVNYYGDLVQVDELGRCHDYGDDEYTYRSRPRYPRYGY